MLRNIKSDPPPKGSKFVALFDDGSGAKLYMRDDHGEYLDAEDGYPDEIFHTEFWMPIPDDFKLWFENH